MIDYSAARLHMVESQLRPNRITDERILDAFLAVPRERFVPAALRGAAYVDNDVPLGGGRWLIEPMVLARLLQLAEIDAADTVLEVGAATGYATAILARLAARVVAVEPEARLADQARAALSELGAANVVPVAAPMAGGRADGAPYPVILVNGAVAAVPDALADQLAEDGRLVTVVKSGSGMGKGTVMTRVKGALSQRAVFDAGTPLLAAFAAVPSFVF